MPPLELETKVAISEVDCRPGLLRRAGLDPADLGSAEVLDNKSDEDTIQDAVFGVTLRVNRKLKPLRQKTS